MAQSHSFSVDVAQKFGVDIALLLNHFSFWYKKNKADDVNLFKGDYWVRMKAKTLQDYFPYYSERQLRYMVDKMIELKLIKRDEFNQKKNDRTKWYTLTKKAKNLLNISTDKNVSNVTHKIVSLTDKNVSPIYKEVDTEYRYNIIIKKLSQNLMLLEVIAMQKKVSVADVKDLVEKFAKHCVAVDHPEHNNNKDLFSHFQNWCGKQKLSRNVLTAEVDWFIKTFNTIAKSKFHVTDETRRLFEIQFQNGFTGDEMKTAISNLYSNSVGNKFHKENNFKFATPEYLLKGDNLNKYLNVKY